MSKGTHILLILIFVLIAYPAFAKHPKTDEVVLKNGNAVTCEIVYLDRGSLGVRTDSMSYVYIRWEDVLHVSSTYVFLLEDDHGRRYRGSLKATEEPGKLEIVQQSERSTVDLISIVSMYQLGSIWRRFEGGVDFGYTYTKSSTQTQLNLSASTLYHGTRWEGGANVTSFLSKSNGETNTNNTTATLGGSLYLNENWLLFSAAQYQHNLELELDRRVVLLGTFGRRFIHTNRMLLISNAGVAWAREDYFGRPTHNDAEGVIGTRFQYFKLISPKVNVTLQFFLFPSFSEGRRRTEFNAQTRFELIHDFFWSVALYDSYDSRPPDASLQNHDYGITTGIAWTFGR